MATDLTASRDTRVLVGEPYGWRPIAPEVEGFPPFNTLAASAGRAPGARSVCEIFKLTVTYQKDFIPFFRY